MTRDEYIQLQHAVVGVADALRSAEDWPLTDFLAAVERAETLGPLLQPTLYRLAADNLARIKRLAEGLRSFQRLAQDVGEVHYLEPDQLRRILGPEDPQP